MSANYTITVTDSLGATATINLLIDLKAKPDGTLIYNPIYRDNAITRNQSTCYDEVAEFEILIAKNQSFSDDFITDVLLVRDQSFATDTISGGGGGS